MWNRSWKYCYDNVESCILNKLSAVSFRSKLPYSTFLPSKLPQMEANWHKTKLISNICLYHDGSVKFLIWKMQVLFLCISKNLCLLQRKAISFQARFQFRCNASVIFFVNDFNKVFILILDRICNVVHESKDEQKFIAFVDILSLINSRCLQNYLENEKSKLPFYLRCFLILVLVALFKFLFKTDKCFEGVCLNGNSLDYRICYLECRESPAVFESAGCPKKLVSRLCDCCGGAVDSSISSFKQLHRSMFNFDFETLYESIWQVVADLWERK